MRDLLHSSLSCVTLTLAPHTEKCAPAGVDLQALRRGSGKESFSSTTTRGSLAAVSYTLKPRPRRPAECRLVCARTQNHKTGGRELDRDEDFLPCRHSGNVSVLPGLWDDETFAIARAFSLTLSQITCSAESNDLVLIPLELTGRFQRGIGYSGRSERKRSSQPRSEQGRHR